MRVLLRVQESGSIAHLITKHKQKQKQKQKKTKMSLAHLRSQEQWLKVISPVFMLLYFFLSGGILNLHISCFLQHLSVCQNPPNSPYLRARFEGPHQLVPGAMNFCFK